MPSYLFIDRYCKVIANIPERGIVTLIGWITLADENSLFMMDENDNHTLIKREQLVGSIVVLMEQKALPEQAMKPDVDCQLA
jgi:hypothetical protein